MKQIKLMADYMATGLWENGFEIEYDQLGLSKELSELIDHWQAVFDTQPFPAEMNGFQKKTFNYLGELILQKLNNEIGKEYEVEYQAYT